MIGGTRARMRASCASRSSAPFVTTGAVVGSRLFFEPACDAVTECSSFTRAYLFTAICRAISGASHYPPGVFLRSSQFPFLKLKFSFLGGQ